MSQEKSQNAKQFFRSQTASKKARIAKFDVKKAIWQPWCFFRRGRGGLYFLFKGQTMNATRYIDVLEMHLLAPVNIHGFTTFQQDSAPWHKAKAVTKWFQTENVNMLQWPGNSPDLKEIQKLWTLILKNFSIKSMKLGRTKRDY